jgi:hypothetical protein
MSGRYQVFALRFVDAETARREPITDDRGRVRGKYVDINRAIAKANAEAFLTRDSAVPFIIVFDDVEGNVVYRKRVVSKSVETMRYTPSIVTIDMMRMPVLRVVAHPPGTHPNSPIKSDLTAVEMVTARGSAWRGCKRAYIDSSLRMVCVFENLRDEVVLNTWEVAK